MMPARLTTRPTRTITMRPPTEELMPRLATAIMKPNSVTINPAIAIAISFSLRFFPRLGLAEHAERHCQQHHAHQTHQNSAICDAGGNQSERGQEGRNAHCLC